MGHYASEIGPNDDFMGGGDSARSAGEDHPEHAGESYSAALGVESVGTDEARQALASDPVVAPPPEPGTRCLCGSTNPEVLMYTCRACGETWFLPGGMTAFNEQLKAGFAAKDAEIARLKDELEDDCKTRDRMSALLTRTANALKGEPEPLHLHSWHDLPEIAVRLKAQLGEAK